MKGKARGSYKKNSREHGREGEDGEVGGQESYNTSQELCSDKQVSFKPFLKLNIFFSGFGHDCLRKMSFFFLVILGIS